MGYYINTTRVPKGGVNTANWELPRFGKATALLTIPGAREITEPDEWVPDLVCVVRGDFEAAGYVYDQDELERFRYRPDDLRPRKWLIVPGAAELAGYRP